MPTDELLDIDITKDPGESVEQENPGDIEIEVPNEDTPPSDDKSKVEVEDKTTPPEKKSSNRSNFKKLAKSEKALKKENADLKAKLAEKSGDVDVDDEDEEEEIVDFDKEFNDELEIEESDTQKLKRLTKETMERFPSMTTKEAITYTKAQQPVESKSHMMFNTKSVISWNKKKLIDLTPEEVAKSNLSPEQRDARDTSRGKSSNPF